MNLFLLLFMFVTSLFAQSVEVTFTGELSLRSAPNFSSRNYIKGQMKAGDKAKVIATKRMGKGYALQVKIESNVHKDKIGWVYFSRNPSSRLLTINSNDVQIDPSYNNFFNETGKLNDLIPKHDRLLANASKSEFVNEENLDDVWKKIYNGQYVFDLDNDEGGAEVPVLKKIENSDGTYSVKSFMIPRNYDRLIALSENLNVGIDLAGACRESDFEKEKLFYEEPGEVSSGCEILESESSSWNDTDLKACFNSLRAKVNPYYNQSNGVNNALRNKKAIYQNMFMLSAKEQDFLGAMITSCGEVSKSSDEEVYLVYKSLFNRKDKGRKQKKAKTRDRRGRVTSWAYNTCEEATVLDVAVQRKQYSMWNYNASHWARCLTHNKPEYKQMYARHLKVFKDFKNEKYESNSTVNLDNITHYHTRNIRPAWNNNPARDSIPVIRLNNRNLGSVGSSHHYFVNEEKPGFSFRYHQYRPKKNIKEARCY